MDDEVVAVASPCSDVAAVRTYAVVEDRASGMDDSGDPWRRQQQLQPPRCALEVMRWILVPLAWG